MDIIDQYRNIFLVRSYGMNTNAKHQFIHIVVDFIEWVIFILITMNVFHVHIIVSVNIASSSEMRR